MMQLINAITGILLCLFITPPHVMAKAPTEVEYQFIQNISYTTPKNTAQPCPKRCKLDIYHPETDGFATVIWLHGGGLRAGQKEIPEQLKNKNFAIVSPNYRLHPEFKAPTYIEDAAAAVAWVFKHIEEYGGDKTKIFLSGYSAGGYLANIIGMDKQWLERHKIDVDQLAGIIALSGHTITHFTIREEMGIPGTQALVDQYAPLFHVRKSAPPMLLVTGDRNLEMLGRYEENAYFLKMLKEVGHKDSKLIELGGYGHDMVAPALPLLVSEVSRLLHRE